MNNGLHIVVEGADATGKGTITKYLVEKYNGVLYGHPGATPLGKELRKLVKHKQDIIMSRHTEQVLMAADYCEFIEQVLKPNHDKLIISDRCNLVSGLVYGLAGDMSPKSLQNIINVPLALGMPKMYLIVLYASVEDLLSRRHQDVVVEDGVEKVLPCKFEQCGLDFHRKVCDGYNHIALHNDYGPMTPDNVVFGWLSSVISSFTYNIYPIDASLPLEIVLEKVSLAVDEIVKFRPEIIRVFDICGKSCMSFQAGKDLFKVVHSVLRGGRKVILSFEFVDIVHEDFYDAAKISYLKNYFSGLIEFRSLIY